MIGIIIDALIRLAKIINIFLIIRALGSWFINEYDSSVGKIYKLIVDLTEPIISPFRKILSRYNTGPIDFSILFAFISIDIFVALLALIAR